MKLIKTLPRYRCEYCRHSGIKRKMEVHEKICWRNPNRHCELCDDKGYYYESPVEGFAVKTPCYYCAQFDATRVPPVEEQGKLTAVSDLAEKSRADSLSQSNPQENAPGEAVIERLGE